MFDIVNQTEPCKAVRREALAVSLSSNGRGNIQRVWEKFEYDQVVAGPKASLMMCLAGVVWGDRSAAVQPGEWERRPMLVSECVGGSLSGRLARRFLEATRRWRTCNVLDLVDKVRLSAEDVCLSQLCLAMLAFI